MIPIKTQTNTFHTLSSDKDIYATETSTTDIVEQKINKTDMLIHQLYQTTRAITKSINRSLDATDIYGSEWAILKIIHERGTMTQTALANYLNIEPAAISKTIRQLEKKFLIKRVSGNDKREKYIYLTELSQEKYSAWFAVIKQNCLNIQEAITDDEQATLFEILEKIKNKVNDTN